MKCLVAAKSNSLEAARRSMEAQAAILHGMSDSAIGPRGQLFHMYCAHMQAYFRQCCGYSHARVLCTLLTKHDDSLLN